MAAQEGGKSRGEAHSVPEAPKCDVRNTSARLLTKSPGERMAHWPCRSTKGSSPRKTGDLSSLKSAYLDKWCRLGFFQDEKFGDTDF